MRKAVWVRLLVLLVLLLAMGNACFAQFGVAISVGFAPPELPVYEQPPCPADGYLWTPGYWAWDPDAGDYYWVPGTWVEAPEVGFLWTPPYWGWESGRYFFHAGYWGPHVGFYGGIVYGFGYFGRGFEGGRWEGGHFFYNRYVNNVNVTVVRNVYETRVENRYENVTRVSFNGGNGGVNARPTAEEEAFARERHVGETTAQNQHIQAARGNTEFRASANRGKPAVAATARPGEFRGANVVAARAGGNYTPPANRGGGGENRPAAENSRPANAGHVKDLPPLQRMAAPNTGDTQRDQKYQQQQDRLYQKQDQERQKLQQKQEQEHQKAQQQNYNQERQQQMEQRHQQQTQQMQQRHQQQQQQMQQRQAPPASHGGSQHH